MINKEYPVTRRNPGWTVKTFNAIPGTLIEKPGIPELMSQLKLALDTVQRQLVTRNHDHHGAGSSCH